MRNFLVGGGGQQRIDTVPETPDRQKINNGDAEVFEIPGPRIIQPVLVGALPTRHSNKTSATPPTAAPSTSRTTTRKLSVTTTSKAHQEYTYRTYTPHVLVSVLAFLLFAKLPILI